MNESQMIEEIKELQKEVYELKKQLHNHINDNHVDKKEHLRYFKGEWVKDE